MKLLNKTSYNELIVTQEDMVCFQIFEEAKTKSNKYGDVRQEWMKLLRKFDPTTGASKIRLHNKFSNYKLDDVIRNTKGWITNIKLLRGDLQKHNVKMFTHE